MQDPTDARRPVAGVSRLATALQLAASLLGVLQWVVLAFALQCIADGGGLHALVPWALALLAVAAARIGLDAWGRRRAFVAARLQLSRWRAQALDAWLATSPLDARRPHAGQLAHELAEQAEAVLPYLAKVDIALWRVRCVPLAILALVAWWSWAAALVLLLAAPVVPLFMALVGWRAQAASEAQMDEAGQQGALLLDRLRGLATLRALGAVDAAARRLAAQSARLHRRTMAVLRIAFVSSAVLELFASLGVAMVAVYVGFHLLGSIGFGAWGRRLSMGEGLMVLMLAPAYFEPLRELAAAWHERAAGRAALAALLRLARPGAPLAAAAPAGAGAAPDELPVEIEGLRFAHAGAAAACLVDFSVHIPAGQHVALTGANGSGKSSLLALIAGLARPDAGTLRIGGLGWDDASAALLRERIGWIGQQPAFVARSVHANLALGRAGDVPAALQAVGLAAIAPAAGLGEGGLGLSGGEARRLALARALLDPRCRLVLADEPTAHLDDATAGLLIERLLEAAAGRTLIVATHDPRLVRRMHRVLCLDAVAPAPAREVAA